MRISTDAMGNYVSQESIRPVSTRQSKRQSPTWGERIQGWLHAFAGSAEPKITRKRDHYQVYDPTTGQSATLSSDMEVRIWLEKRYSR